jgi:hypothetical protein
VLVVLFIFLDLVALLLATLWNLSSLLASLLARPLIFAIALLAAVRLASALAALLSALLAFAITVRLIRMLFLVCHLCSPFFSNY